jgi:hypothetical protein
VSPESMRAFKQNTSSKLNVFVVTFQDSTSSRLLPDSSYSNYIRYLFALVHK